MKETFGFQKLKIFFSETLFSKETAPRAINSIFLSLRTREEVVCKNRKPELKLIVKANVQKILGLRVVHRVTKRMTTSCTVSDNDWYKQVTTNDSEIEQMTMSDSGWQRVVQRMRTSESK